MRGRRVVRVLLGIGSVLALSYVGVALVVMFRQRAIYYHPPHVTPAELVRYAAERQMLPWTNSAGLRIGWWRPSRLGTAQGTVLVTHGNGGTAVGRGYIADPLQAALPLEVRILEYPGYADRPGSPSQETILAGAEEAFGALPKDRSVYLVGESPGTGAAAWLAGKFPARVAGVCLLVPYDNLTAVARHRIPWLPVGLLLWDKFPADTWLGGYHGPVAFCVAGADQTIPPERGLALCEGYPGPKRLWDLPGQGHMDATKRSPEWWREVASFWRTGR